MKSKCDKCIRGARVSITGATPHNTLKMDMGGAVLYVIPRGIEIEVALNTENLIDGNYTFAIWDGKQWLYTTSKEANK